MGSSRFLCFYFLVIIFAAPLLSSDGVVAVVEKKVGLNDYNDPSSNPRHDPPPTAPPAPYQPLVRKALCVKERI